MIFIGIDPGVSGGLAFLNDNGTEPGTVKMPETERDLFDYIDVDLWRGQVVRAVVERVHGGIGGPGGRRQGAAGMFTYGKNYGAVLMALTAARIPFDTLPPQQWQKVIGVTYPKGATQTERKNISKRRAQQLFPTLTVTHAIADALLLAETCRRIHAGGLDTRRSGDSIHGEEEVSEEDRQLEDRQRQEREEHARDQRGQTAKERREAEAAAPGRAPRHGAGARSDAR